MELIARLPEDINASSSGEKRAFQQLLGELMRRVGKFDEAKQYFLDLSKQLTPDSDESLGLIAAFEVQLIDKRDAQPHLIAEAIKAGEENPDVWRKRREPSLSDATFLTQTHTFKLDRDSEVFWAGSDKLYGSASLRPTQFDLVTGTATAIGTSIPWGRVSAYSRDGNTFVTQGPGSWGLVQRDAGSFDVRHSVEMPVGTVGGTQRIVMTYDGKSALVELDNRLMAFDIGSDSLRPVPSPTFSEGRPDWWLEAADPTGPRIALRHEDAIAIWDYEKGELLRQLKPPGWIKSMTIDLDVSYSSDGKKLFIGADAYWDKECELTVWDSQNGAQLFKKRVKGAPGAQLAVSPDEKLVAMMCGKSLNLWDTRLSDPPLATARAKGDSEFREIAFSPDSRRLAVRLDDALLVFSIAR